MSRTVVIALALMLLVSANGEAAKARCVVAVSVLDGEVHSVPTIRCTPGSRIKWVVTNADETDYDVVFTDFTDHKVPKNPTKLNAHVVKVDAGDTETSASSSKVRPAADFSPNLPYGKYKYTIYLRERGKATNTYKLDPELEVIPPVVLGK